MTEPEITEHIQAPLPDVEPEFDFFRAVPWPEVEDHMRKGWRVCDGWRSGAHHLRYALPMHFDPRWKEIWRPVLGFEGIYEISNWGNIRSLTRQVRTVSKYGTETLRTIPGCELKLNNLNGYRLVGVCDGGKVKTQYVHALVAEAFIGARPEGMWVNHKNGLRCFNNVVNLEWSTPAENNLHSYRVLGRSVTAEQRQARSLRMKGKKPSAKCIAAIKEKCSGERNWRAKITEDQARRIHSRLKAGERQIDIATSEGVTSGIVFSIASGRAWGHLYRPVEPPDA